MKRFFLACVAACALLLPALADDATIAGDFKKLDELLHRKPKDRAEAQAFIAEARQEAKAFCERWDGKAKGEDEIYLAKAEITVAQGDREKGAEHFQKARAHVDAALKANPENAEAKELSKKMDALLKGQTAREEMEKRRAEAEKKRQALVNKPAPSLEIEEVLDGEKLTLDGMKGKVVIVDFWATWCPPCRAVIPHLVELRSKFKDKGLEVLGVTRFYTYGFIPTEGNKGEQKKNLSPDEEREVNRKCAKALKIEYPICFSTKAAETYGVTGIPQLIVVDRKGVVRYVKVGAGDHSELDKIIETCLAEVAE